MSNRRLHPSRLAVLSLAASLGIAAFPGASPVTPAGAPIIRGTDALIERVRTKVVFIEVQTGSGGRTGTGFFAAPGRVLTSEHVVRSADRIMVWANGVPYRAHTVRTAPEFDLALLALPDSALLIKPLAIAEARTTLLGEAVLIVSAPRNTTARQSLISGHFRGPTWFEWPARRYTRALELAAQVEPGDSGSPVLRVRDGAVIGVLRARDTAGSEGVSHRAWAVPIDVAFPLLGRAVGKSQQATHPSPDEEFYLRHP